MARAEFDVQLASYQVHVYPHKSMQRSIWYNFKNSIGWIFSSLARFFLIIIFWDFEESQCWIFYGIIDYATRLIFLLHFDKFFYLKVLLTLVFEFFGFCWLMVNFLAAIFLPIMLTSSMHVHIDASDEARFFKRNGFLFIKVYEQIYNKGLD